MATVLIMGHDVDDDTLSDLEAGLHPQQGRTQDASNSDSWLTTMNSSFTRLLALGIFQNRVSSHHRGVPSYAEDDDNVMHANDEDLTGMKIMFQMDSFPTNFVIMDCSKQTGVSCVSPSNAAPPSRFRFESPITSSPSATSSNTPLLTPDSSVGILDSTSLEIADTQSGLAFPLHTSHRSPTPSLEHRCSINDGKMSERPRVSCTKITKNSGPLLRPQGHLLS